jgi:hypothetical protein
MVEYTSIMRNGIWDIVSRPEEKSVVSSRWLDKIKHAANGSIEKFKVRFVKREQRHTKVGFGRRKPHESVGSYGAFCTHPRVTLETVADIRRSKKRKSWIP